MIALCKTFFRDYTASLMKEVILSKGLKAFVDDADFERVSKYKWTASLESRGTKWYAIRWTKKHEPNGRPRRKVRLHYYVLELTPSDLPEGHVIDHRNHNGLDCRRANLEIITQALNMERSLGWKKKQIAEPCL